MTTITPTVFDPAHLRRVYGAFPTGVTAVAALVDGRPTGLAASSFTTVSLEPALVSVCVAHTSTTWPSLQTAPRLGISILSAGQGAIVRRLAARNVDRFAGVPFRTTQDGAILLDGASGWLEVSIDQQVRAGDHDIIVLAVHELNAEQGIGPLVFHASTFRNLQP